MAITGEGTQNIFSFIVREKKDQNAGPEQKASREAASKYTKSATSLGSGDTEGDTTVSEVAVVEEPAKKVVIAAEVEYCKHEDETTDIHQKEPPAQPSSTKLPDDASVRHQESGPSHVHESEIHVLRTHKRDRKFKHRKHSLWYRLRRRHKHMGVVEVNAHHLFYYRLKALSFGMSSLVTDAERVGPLENLSSEHYSAVRRKELKLDLPEVEISKKDPSFLFETYAPSVFATIRRAVSVEEGDYLNSIISHQHPFLEFISNSRSGQDFFLSHDMRYLIKTNRERDVKFLLSVLGDYLQHFLSYPHSLLVKYVGCYAIKFPNRKKMYFLVMKNIFYPADRIEDRFDVKGCTAGRYQEPDLPGSHTITVLKDQNFFQEELQLVMPEFFERTPSSPSLSQDGMDPLPPPPVRRFRSSYSWDAVLISLKEQNRPKKVIECENGQWFMDQITADATFLRNLNVMDYSLLVGRQKLHPTEQAQSFPVLVDRIAKSRLSETTEDLYSFNLSSLTNITSDITHRDSHDISHSILPGVVESEIPEDFSVYTRLKNGLRFPHSLAEGSGNFSSQRRRLLPLCPNALHIVDGPEYRYFFGIVDFLTRWTLRQKTARLWKMIKYGCGEHSTMPPDYYSKRFIRFLTNRVS